MLKTGKLLSIVVLVALAIAGFATLSYTGGQGLSQTRTTIWQVGSSVQLQLVGSVSLPNATGRIDHMSIDSTRGRLFVAVRGNNSVAVIDLGSGRIARVIGGFDEPQNALYVSSADRLFVSNGGSGVVDVLDGSSFQILKTIQFTSDADNMRYSPERNLVYVAFGQGSQSGLGAVNVTSSQIVWIASLAGHPENLQADGSLKSVFVNVPAEDAVVVIDAVKGLVVSKWSLNGTLGNYPMALDENGNRLFVGTWHPPRLLVLDTKSGRLLETLPICSDADDIHFDSQSRAVLISCGEGYVNIINQTATDTYAVSANVATQAGARTSLLAPDIGRFFLAVPASSSAPATVEIFAVHEISAKGNG